MRKGKGKGKGTKFKIQKKWTSSPKNNCDSYFFKKNYIKME